MADQHMLSTIDNPYNPFTHFDQWYQWDLTQGYNTSSFLARIVVTSDELSEAEQNTAMESAIQEIIRENVLGIYIRVKEDDVIVPRTI